MNKTPHNDPFPQSSPQGGLPTSGPLASASSSIRLHNRLSLSVSQEVVRALLQITDKASSITTERIYASLSSPPKPELGEIAVPCFQIAKEVGEPPPVIAQKLAEELKASSVAKFTNTGPYLNAKVSQELLVESVLAEVLSGKKYSGRLIDSPPRIMIEFSQPNTHKELHVGHMRNICLGDALAKTLSYVGISVVTATFPGDVGTHVAKCLWYLKTRNKEAPPEHDQGEWLGKMYTQATLALEADENTDKAKENVEVLSDILRQLEAKQGEYYDLWTETREWSVGLMKEAYAWAEVAFDKWYWESEVDSPSVAMIKELYAAGRLEKSEDALGIDLSDVNLGFCLLLKSDGNGLYATKDFLLAQKKFEDFPIDKSLYLVDMRQTYHFKQVFEALKRLEFSHAADCYHLPYNYVKLPDGAMSSRKGNIVPLTQLTESMQETIKEQYLTKIEDSLPPNKIQEIARVVAQGAIKFGMNRMDPNTTIVFDLNEWLRLDGDSGPYVQYTAARINSVLRKFEQSGISAPADYSLLNLPTERDILNSINRFNDVAVKVVETLKTNLLCEYLIDLSARFNSFYAQAKIVDVESPALSAARVDLCRALVLTLERGLLCLGIRVPERM